MKGKCKGKVQAIDRQDKYITKTPRKKYEKASKTLDKFYEEGKP